MSVVLDNIIGLAWPQLPPLPSHPFHVHSHFTKMHKERFSLPNNGVTLTAWPMSSLEGVCRLTPLCSQRATNKNTKRNESRKSWSPWWWLRQTMASIFLVVTYRSLQSVGTLPPPPPPHRLLPRKIQRWHTSNSFQIKNGFQVRSY